MTAAINWRNDPIFELLALTLMDDSKAHAMSRRLNSALVRSFGRGLFGADMSRETFSRRVREAAAACTSRSLTSAPSGASVFSTVERARRRAQLRDGTRRGELIFSARLLPFHLKGCKARGILAHGVALILFEMQTKALFVRDIPLLDVTCGDPQDFAQQLVLEKEPVSKVAAWVRERCEALGVIHLGMPEPSNTTWDCLYLSLQDDLSQNGLLVKRVMPSATSAAFAPVISRGRHGGTKIALNRGLNKYNLVGDDAPLRSAHRLFLARAPRSERDGIARELWFDLVEVLVHGDGLKARFMAGQFPGAA